MAAGRPTNIVPSVLEHLSLPADIIAAVELELYSDALGRVPYAAWTKLITELLTEWLARRNIGAAAQETVNE